MKLSSAFRPARISAFAAITAGLIFSSGCTTPVAPARAATTTKFTLEDTDRFALLEQAADYGIACTGLQYHVLADGRLEVVANLKNRENRPLDVQVDCVFRDPQNPTAVDETPWQRLTLAPNTTEAVHFTASTPAGKRYTVRVRPPR
jgi:hypothetical protein